MDNLEISLLWNCEYLCDDALCRIGKLGGGSAQVGHFLCVLTPTYPGRELAHEVILGPGAFICCPFWGGGYFVVGVLFIVASDLNGDLFSPCCVGPMQ